MAMGSPQDARPDPERLLAAAKREESRARRGRLKVFLGMAPGVGKTYAMLAAAHRMAAEGHDVVIGVAETHGRRETEQMLLGLDLIPQRSVEYRGVTLKEFDLGAALARRPEILIVDELAHTNAPGGKFEKRWQDVQELLDAGINVFSTLNIQHVESLNDIVAQVTGVKVRETVPDSVIEQADEIELVDLPPDALIERLRAGKVYVPESIQHAIESFFQRSNLAALRELALRHAAQWVEQRMQEYKNEQGVRAVWPAADRVMVCVSPAPSSTDLVRAAKRMAAGLRANLIAVYIETPRAARLRPVDRERVLQTLQLAESLGAETSTLTTPPRSRDAAGELVNYARSRNVTKIVLGKTGQSRWRAALFGSFMDEVIRRSGEIDVHVIRAEDDRRHGTHRPKAVVATASMGWIDRPSLKWSSYFGALAVVAVATFVSMAFYNPPDLSGLAMIFVIGVLLVAWRFGRWLSVLASILSALSFNFFFTEPRYTFFIDDPQYVLAFLAVLVTGLFVASLASRMRNQADVSRERERRTSLLYSMSRELMGAGNRSHVAKIGCRHLYDTFDADVAILGLFEQSATATGSLDVLATQGLPDWIDERERAVARWAFDHSQTAGLGTRALPSATGRYVPLVTGEGKFGVLALRPRDAQRGGAFASTPQLLLLETFADQIAVALERVALRDAQQRAQVNAEREQIRSALLSSVSHDLRTPLASIAGSASALLQDDRSVNPETRRELTQGIVEEAQRLNDLIGNLMFATRLESGIELKKEWTTVEEFVGAGLSRHRQALARRPFKTLIPQELPMIRGDAAMLAQVIHNLVDNALRYTAEGTSLEISAWRTDQSVLIKVADQGSGIEPAEFGRVFERLYRGRAAEKNHRSGMGLGLTICEGIIRAHGGRIWVEPNQPSGAAFHFALPVELPQPTVPDEAEAPQQQSDSVVAARSVES
jgi:two-component system sensor histidine kinase KdpD